MLRVAMGQSEGIRTERVIADVLEQCATQLGEHAPDVGILLIAGVFVHPVVLAAIEARFPGMPLVGMTTQGTIASTSGFAEDAIALLLLASDEITITVGLGRNCKDDPMAAAREALAMARTGHDQDESLCLAFPYIFSGDPYALMHHLDQELRPCCAVFGAGSMSPSSANAKSQGASLFFGREELTDVLPIVLFSGPLTFSYCVENSWTPVGERAVVSQASGRVVERIGERTALEFYQYYLGEHSRPAFAFPLAVFEGPDDDYYLRIPLSYERDTGAVTYSGPVPEGAEVHITEAVRDRMLEGTDHSVASALERMAEAHRPALALIFSCDARRRILGTQTPREAEIVRSRLSHAPMFGMYGASELAPTCGRSVIHQATMVGLFLGTRETDAWSPSDHARGGTARDELRTRELLERRLLRSQDDRAILEETRELNDRLLRTITREVEASRAMIARQNAELERLYAELAVEKQKTDELLLQILPREVADELKRRGQVEPVFHDAVTVLFADFKDFTRLASSMAPRALLHELDFFFSQFDEICDTYGLEKLKTIGDAYMCAGGIPAANPSHAHDVVGAAWDMQDLMLRTADEHRAPNGRPWQLRIGINTGPLVAGVIGQRKFAYDIWGDTVNIAARLESAGEAGRINIARTTREAVNEHFICQPRGRIPVKNAGEIEMYYVVERLHEERS